MTKRIYEKPTLAKRDMLTVIAAAPCTSNDLCGPQ
jgi:hypothetical protein